jgi:hypothetical protein
VTAERIGGEAPAHVRRLAALHGAAAFAPASPTSADTAEAWRQADLARHAINGTRPGVRRWRAGLSTRSLRRRRRLRTGRAGGTPRRTGPRRRSRSP